VARLYAQQNCSYGVESHDRSISYMNTDLESCGIYHCWKVSRWHLKRQAKG